jgi:hypothetical protein
MQLVLLIIKIRIYSYCLSSVQGLYTTMHKNKLIVGIVHRIDHVAYLIATSWCVMVPDICSSPLALTLALLLVP